MAYVYPNSTVEYFGDIGISPDYENCLYFSSTSAKDTAFNNLPRIARETQVSYVAKDGKTFRSSLPMSTLINAGYMRFKNTSFENKWFYAFITSVDYANNGMTEVTFQLDVVTTWMGAFSLGQCFVERQHTLSDGIGDNIADEGLDTGEYITNWVATSGYISSNTLLICIGSTYDPDITDDEQQGLGEEYGGLYSGVKYFYFNTVSGANDFIKKLNKKNKQDAIIGISMSPRTFALDAGEPIDETKTRVFDKPAVGDTLDGYTPRNNKLYTYPYNYLSVYNSEGNFANLRFERWSGTKAQFIIYGLSTLNTELTCVPLNYKLESRNWSERISMSGFPLCAYNTDAYLAYLAQKKNELPVDLLSIGTSALGGAITGATAGSFGGPVGAIGGAVVGAVGAGVSSASSKAMDFMQKRADYSNRPPQSNGSQATEIMTSLKQKEFFFRNVSVNRNYAIMLDDYFTAFGYAVRQVITPNMNARPHFTYVKTLDCTVHGNLPASDGSIIESIFNKGVRFWNTISEIGDYSLDNSPT